MQVYAIQAVSEPKATLPSRNYFATNGQAMSLQEHEAWLEHAGEQRRLEGNCSIGRAGLNTIVVDSPKVSRLHSIIHLEENGAFWLIDLGSSNGTFHNRRRIHEPVRLRDRDEINIGGTTFVFHQPRGKPSAQIKGAPLATLAISAFQVRLGQNRIPVGLNVLNAATRRDRSETAAAFC